VDGKVTNHRSGVTPAVRHRLSGLSTMGLSVQTNDKVGQFRLPIKSANTNLSSVVQKSAGFVCH